MHRLTILIPFFALMAIFVGSTSTGCSASASDGTSQANSHQQNPAKDQTNQTLFKGGSKIGEITKKGEVWLNGEKVGEITADGEIWVAGTKEGSITKSGKIWKAGSNIGEIEKDGTVWRDSERVGSVEKDGSVWIGGTKEASFKGGDARNAAIVFFYGFFKLDK